MGLNGALKRAGEPEQSSLPLAKRVKPLFSQGQEIEPLKGDRANEDQSMTIDRSALLHINSDYARKFEHNKKREELHRLQEKFGKARDAHDTKDGNDTDSGPETSSSESEDEDDEGILASKALDVQFQDTLDAIRKKDPRVYDKDSAFFPENVYIEEDHRVDKSQSSKPVYLADYHRQNLVDDAALEDGKTAPYVQQQELLKAQIMHGISEQTPLADFSEEHELLTKKPIQPTSSESMKVLDELDVGKANEDPEAYLSKFMATRAWVPLEQSKPVPFESDDEEADQRAEDFETAYNLRFEDPSKSNEKLTSHARDIVAMHSVRKDSLKPRQRARIAERERKEAERQARQEEQQRLKHLKRAELHEKVQKIKEAAGFKGEELGEDEWAAFLAGNWDDDQWEAQMQKRFDDAYYAEKEFSGASSKDGKKPQWKDDIDISDIVPGFVGDDGVVISKDDPTKLQCQDDEETQREGGSEETSVKDARDAQRDRKRTARRERQKIDQLLDEKIEVDEILSSFGKKHQGRFRYRETSPLAFGLTADDILTATDSQLNQYAGLKKLAAFRDPDKKRKDQKRLGRKARLSQWRKEAFGDQQKEHHGTRPRPKQRNNRDVDEATPG